MLRLFPPATKYEGGKKYCEQSGAGLIRSGLRDYKLEALCTQSAKIHVACYQTCMYTYTHTHMHTYTHTHMYTYTHTHAHIHTRTNIHMHAPAHTRIYMHIHTVSRLFCESESFKMDLILDVNTQLYPVGLGDKFRLLLTSTLREDGVPDDGDYLNMGNGDITMM